MSMTRSQINEILARTQALFDRFAIALPPFAHWSPGEMRARIADDAAHVARQRLGWDVTDYGAGRFDEFGLVLFTLRNGEAADLAAGRGRLYAEKLLVSRVDQLSPLHTHRIKAEDIINRGGGRLIVELHASDAAGGADPHAPVRVFSDGIWREVAAGGRLALAPGESVTLMPGDWHAFWAEGEDVLIGEVSTVNDDQTDNVFRQPLPRFATVTEDTAPDRLLVSDYPPAV